MKPIYLWTISAVLISLVASVSVSAHCEIPCGIYDDQLRAQLIAEHATTIEKSMTSILALSTEKPVNYNQLARWVSNKEGHANEIQHIVSPAQCRTVHTAGFLEIRRMMLEPFHQIERLCRADRHFRSGFQRFGQEIPAASPAARGQHHPRRNSDITFRDHVYGSFVLGTDIDDIVLLRNDPLFE